MPLRMLKLKRGQVLIADPPVTDGSYAEIHFHNGGVIRVHHPEGAVVNNKPALVPVPESLDDILRTSIKTQMDELADQDGNVTRLPICVGIMLNSRPRIKMPPDTRGQREYGFGPIRKIVICNAGEAPVQVGR